MAAKQPNTVGSIFEHVPYITQLQSRFAPRNALLWLEQFWHVTIPIIMIYLALVFGGRFILAKRQRFDLRKYLLCWNMGLAIFSVIGFISVGPNLIFSIYHNGLQYSVCHTTALLDPHLSLWAFVFTLSKVVELGDTAFIVLRKGPLTFLHWYHHITVLFYTWYILGHSGVSTFAIGQWFGAMNYGVHSIMYSYYAVRAAGYKVSSSIAQVITVLQISQMFAGVYVNVLSYTAYINGQDCHVSMDGVYMGVVVYGSYLVLFIHFFIRRYLL